ncbi:MAG: ATP-dependent endonuclease [Caldilineaceae bacterium]|nr:ATP-dependent endonuclease [Caldilineaceae bacterium]MDE0337823.1 ATP-dependent endonuclease [Caldilineaceae bacterium]
MLIREVRVKNFRSILEESLPCDSLTALVGRNGSGKSSFLKAVELFYDPSAGVTAEDFYAEDVNQDIEIAVTYSELSAEAKELFSAYIDNDSLTVVRVFSDPAKGKSGSYHGMRLQNPAFVKVRTAGGAMDVRQSYNEIRQKTEYSALPTAGSQAAVLLALAEWESQNPAQCSRLRDEGQFFGFTEVGSGYLGRYTRFIYVPAVRDATEDATEGRGSSVTEIMDLVVRNALANRKEVMDFKQRTQDQYREIMDPEKLTELNDLSQGLTNTLRSYVPDSKVFLQWSELTDISIPMPQAQIKLSEDDYESTVEKTGHGLQRAFIVTMLQHLTSVRVTDAVSEGERSSKDDTSPETREIQLPNLVLAIEEPELYQHPSRQRHLASVLLRLATGAIPGVADNTQVIYTTHSPLFVGLDRFDQIRVLQKISSANGKPKTTHLKRAEMEKVAEELWGAGNKQGEKYTAETLRPRLQSILTPWMGEGFFADVVVLVEGEDDRAAISGIAKSMDHDLDSEGVAVIPCFGKTNIDRPLVIFRQLDIPVYVIWDGDSDARDPKPEDNKYLLRLLGRPEQDWPDFVEESSACFKFNLEKTLEDEMGKETFITWLSEAQRQTGIVKKKHALKNPTVIEQVVGKAASSGKAIKSLEKIIENIISLKIQPEAQP